MAGGIKVLSQTPHDERSEGSTATGTKQPGNKTALDVRDRSGVTSIGSDVVDSYNAATFEITAAAHAAILGDTIRMTSGSGDKQEFSVFSVGTNTIKLGEDPTVAPAAADTFDILRPVSPTYSSTGGFTSVTTFIRDTVNQEVTKDTVTAANTRGLPVEIVATNGAEITITAGNIDVQLSHAGANPDSTQIGNGTNLMAVNASLEAQVRDDDANTALTAIQTAVEILDNIVSGSEAQVDIVASLPAGTNNIGDVDVLSSALPTGASTSALQTSSEAILTTIDVDTGSIATDASTLAGAVSGSEMQVDVVAALPAGTNTIGNVTQTYLDCVDFLDTPLLDASSVNIPASAGVPTTFVASLAAAVQRVQIADTTGSFIGLYSDPAGTPVLEAIFGPGSDSTVDVQIPAATVLGLRNMENSAITSGQLIINFLG